MNEKTPPPNLSAKNAADWWRKNGASMNNIETTGDLERECPRCHSNNPCTGIDDCIACGESLENAQRVLTNQHTARSQNY